jgi:hypothetical protein
MHYFWLLTLSSPIFSNFLVLFELHSLNLKLCSQYNKKFILHLIVAPQLSSGLRHNYSTKTRQAGQANEQSMSMGIPDEKFNNIGTCWCQCYKTFYSRKLRFFIIS